MYAGVYTFIAGAIVVGFGVGFWLQGKLDASNQNITLPSAFNAKEYTPVLKGGARPVSS